MIRALVAVALLACLFFGPAAGLWMRVYPEEGCYTGSGARYESPTELAEGVCYEMKLNGVRIKSFRVTRAGDENSGASVDGYESDDCSGDVAAPQFLGGNGCGFLFRDYADPPILGGAWVAQGPTMAPTPYSGASTVDPSWLALAFFVVVLRFL